MSVRIGTDEDRTIEGALAALVGEPTTLTPGAAIGILAEAAASDDEELRTRASAGLTDVLSTHDDPQVRVGAAAALGRIASPGALRALRDVVKKTDDGQLLAAASYALARTGTKRDLALLRDNSSRTGSEPGRERALAAARILSHRLGVSDAASNEKALPDENGRLLAPPDRGAKIQAIAVTSAERVEEIRQAESHLLPDRATAVGAFSCGARKHVVLASANEADIALLAQRPAIAAALIGVNESTGTTFVRWVVLTRPASRDDGPDRGDVGDLVVTVTRSTGEVGFVGRGQVVDNEVAVTISSVEMPGASAVFLTATLTSNGLTIEGVSDAMTTVPRLVPKRAPALAFQV